MRFPLAGSWQDADSADTFIEYLHEAGSFLQRLQGLQFSKTIEPGCGLLLQNCRSVHTMWMRFAIDVVFIDNELTVLEIHRGVKPWRILMPKAKNVAHVIEMASGWEVQCKVGGRTEIVK